MFPPKARFILLLSVIVSASVMMMAVPSAASVPTVDLGTAAGFAVLAGRSIDNVAVSTISGTGGGDVGVSPGGLFNGSQNVTLTGVVHLADAVAAQAQQDLTAAYNDAAARIPATTIAHQLGGVTLSPGVYESMNGRFLIDGTLTLDAQANADAVFIFKTQAGPVPTPLRSEPESKVVLINGAHPCRVFWQVDGDALLGASSLFGGNILALDIIELMPGAKVLGRVMTTQKGGKIYLHNNTITADACPEVIPDEEGEEEIVPEEIPEEENEDGIVPEEEGEEETPAPLVDFAYGYINGYDTGNVGPEDSITREQVSASLYRILKQAGKTTDYNKPTVSDFTDLATSHWSFAAVEYMVSVGAIPEGITVKPAQPITRGETAKLIAMSNQMALSQSTHQFPDLPQSHPYYDYMNMLVEHGLLKGYPDGTIKPDGLITRAEHVTMVNRYIGRDNRYDIGGYPSLYKDLTPSHWAFAEIQRASFGFTPVADHNGFFHVDPNQDISKAVLDN